jgi:hypothetical protein
MLALAFKSSGAAPDQARADSASVRPNEETTVAANATAAADTTPASSPIAMPQTDTLSPPAGSEQTPPPTPPQVTPEPRRSQPERVRPRSGAPSGASTVVPPARNVVDTAKTLAPVDPPKDTKAAEPPPSSSTMPDESAETGRAAVLEGIGGFLQAVNSGSVAEVDRLLRGPDRPRSALLTLVRERRLTMSGQPDGMPSFGGGDLSVPFDARMSWRTPFGSVRRNTVPMQAEFVRSGGAWRLTSVRMLRPVDLR